MSNLPRQYLARILSQTPNAAIWSSILSVGVNLSEIFVNQSARASIDGEHAIQHFLQAYPRSRSLMNSLLFFSGFSGVLAFCRTKDRNWLIGAVLMILGIPYGVFLESPIADQLKFLTLDARSEKVRSLFASWNTLQFGKLSLALGGATVFYWLTRR